MNGIGRWRRPLAFIAVGAAAASVHWAVAVLLVERATLAPSSANVGGWLVAFGVSFAGHARVTFADRRASAPLAALRFAVLSAAGFALNAAAYGLLLRAGVLRYDIALAAVLIAVASITYLASLRWVFTPGSRPRSAPHRCATATPAGSSPAVPTDAAAAAARRFARSRPPS